MILKCILTVCFWGMVHIMSCICFGFAMWLGFDSNMVLESNSGWNQYLLYLASLKPLPVAKDIVSGSLCMLNSGDPTLYIWIWWSMRHWRWHCHHRVKTTAGWEGHGLGIHTGQTSCYQNIKGSRTLDLCVQTGLVFEPICRGISICSSRLTNMLYCDLPEIGICRLVWFDLTGSQG